MHTRDHQDEAYTAATNKGKTKNDQDQFVAQQERFKHQLKELRTMGTEINRLKNENKRTKTSI